MHIKCFLQASAVFRLRCFLLQRQCDGGFSKGNTRARERIASWSVERLVISLSSSTGKPFFLFVCLFSRWGEGRSWWPSVHRCNFIPRLQLRNQSPRFTTTTAESTNLFIPPNFSVLLSKAEQLSQGSHLPVIPGWPLLCLSAIPTNNASQ